MWPHTLVTPNSPPSLCDHAPPLFRGSTMVALKVQLFAGVVVRTAERWRFVCGLGWCARAKSDHIVSVMSHGNRPVGKVVRDARILTRRLWSALRRIGWTRSPPAPLQMLGAEMRALVRTRALERRTTVTHWSNDGDVAERTPLIQIVPSDWCMVVAVRLPDASVLFVAVHDGRGAHVPVREGVRHSVRAALAIHTRAQLLLAVEPVTGSADTLPPPYNAGYVVLDALGDLRVVDFCVSPSSSSQPLSATPLRCLQVVPHERVWRRQDWIEERRLQRPLWLTYAMSGRLSDKLFKTYRWWCDVHVVPVSAPPRLRAVSAWE